MIFDIILDNFNVPFSDIVDNDRYECFKVEGENRWLVRKREITLMDKANEAVDVPN